MLRAAPALALLLATAPLLALPGEAQFGSPNLQIPTLAELRVGDLNVTLWIMRDASSLSLGAPDPGNPLGTIFNLNFSAGHQGIFYIKANRTENATYQMRARLVAQPPTLGVVAPNASIPLGVRTCSQSELTLTCALNETTPAADYAVQFYTFITTPPGPLALRVEVESWRDQEGTLQFQARGNTTYELNIQPPVPAFAASRTTGSTEVYAWVQGSSLGLTAGGCQGGSNVRQDANVSKGFPSQLCVFAVPRGSETLRLTANVTAPPSLNLTPSSWQSQPFNASSGGASAPLGSLFVQAAPDAPLGAGTITVAYTLERLENGTWVPAGSDQVLAPYAITAGPTIRGPGGIGGIRWELQLPILAAAAGGLGYLVYKHRPPKVEPRSQALRELRKGKGDGGTGPATQEAAQQQRVEAEEAAWDKKRIILEAKREDILKSIRIAEERKERGEITDHVLGGIRERKQRQLEQVEKEMEELRS